MLRALRARRRTRATVMLEFALVMPLFLLFLVLMVDLSKIMMAKNVAQDSAFAAARAGAQIGDGLGGSDVEANAAAQAAFDSDYALRQNYLSTASLILPSGSSQCDAGDNYLFKAQVAYSVDLNLISWAAGLFNRFGDRQTQSNFDLMAYGASRCEVVR